MKFSKYTFKAVTPVMALFQKQHRLLFKQGYDNLRSTRGIVAQLSRQKSKIFIMN